MAIRNIVKIDEDKCNGCGLCVPACAEGAIQIIDGKARLVSEIYCDGLGACLGHCPMGAITIEQREAEEFDEKATEEHLKKMDSAAPQPVPAQKQKPPAGGCPGAAMMSFMTQSQPRQADNTQTAGPAPSRLGQWPVQLHLVSPAAPYFKNADLLLTADCFPFAMGDFHNELLKGRAIAIACPKLDDVNPYIEKLSAIIRDNDLASLSVVHMEVPCCFGLVKLAEAAIARSGVNIQLNDITIGLDGTIRQS